MQLIGYWVAGQVRTGMTEDISQFVRAAEAAANAGRWDEAEKLWFEVRQRDPKNAKAAFSLGVHAMRKRDFAGACALLGEARQANPRDLFTLLTLSKACREKGDDAGEEEALEAALAVDPYYLPALLGKAQRLERKGQTPTAAMYYHNAIRIAPPEPHWPQVLRPQLAHARDIATKHASDFGASLEAALGSSLSTLPPDKAERWREAASIMAGLTEPYRQHANQLYVPRLPAIPFYDRKLFPWAAELEGKTKLIRDELM